MQSLRGRVSGRLYCPYGMTSGASAIITVAAVIVQAMNRAKYGAHLSPQALRPKLKEDGTEAAGSEPIGVMRNLRAIADKHL